MFQRHIIFIISILFIQIGIKAQTRADTLQAIRGYAAIFQQASKKLQERNVDSAIYFANQSKKFAEERLGKKAFGLYAQSIFFTSIAFQTVHNYESAMKAVLEYLQVTSENTGKKNMDYLRGLMGLSNLYFIMNNYGKAEESVQEAMALCELLKGKQTREYLRLLKISAQIYAAVQNDDKAAKLEKEALEIETKLADTNSDEKNNLLSDLARIYKNEQDFKKADSLYNILLSAAKNQNGINSYQYAMALENLGAVYAEAGDWERAKKYYTESAPILKNNKGTRLDYAASAQSLGNIYLQEKNFLEAEKYYLEAAKITEVLAGTETLNYQLALTKLVRLYRKWGNVEKTLLYTGLQIKNWNQLWIRSFTTFTESDKARSLESEISYLHYAFSVLYDTDEKTARPLVPVLFNVNNDIDGLLLQNNSRITQFVAAKKDSTLSNLYTSWISYKKQYAIALQVNAGEKDNSNIRLVEANISELEKQLLRYDPALEKILRFNSFSYQDIARSLKSGEALIKWVNFNYHDSQRFTDSIFYGAFISLAGKDEPLFVKVCEQKKLQELLKSYYNSGDRGAAEEAKESSVKRDSLHFYLYDLLWKPLLLYIGNASTVYNIPSGQIHRISFAALQNDKGKFLFDLYRLHQLLSAREIVNNGRTNVNKSALLFGGVDFSNQEPGTTLKNNDSVQQNFQIYHATRGGSFTALAGTVKEVNFIRSVLNGMKWKVQLYTGKKASKLNFTQNVQGSHSILHLATHGFYFPPKKDKTNTTETFNDKIKYTDKPLLRSGIVFSGVNKYWSSNTMGETHNNGIVTAQEIANLDLSKTGLVVLSACETALGDINSTEGVYGLQRGFKMAGVNKMIMSLWPVPDKETAELMQHLYENIARGETFYNSFYKARAKIKQKYKDPYQWAGFVLIGE